MLSSLLSQKRDLYASDAVAFIASISDQFRYLQNLISYTLFRRSQNT